MFNIIYQNAVSPIIEMILKFHDWLIIFMVRISFVTLGGIYILKNRYSHRKLIDSQTVESVWTVIPVFILIGLGVPSLQLLYIVEGEYLTAQTIKVLGHQWYWEYDYPDRPTYDSYLVFRNYRHLDVDNRLLVPVNTLEQLLISAADVLHSWTIPVMGVKADAVPGRVNKMNLLVKRPGIFFGQCSEICGRNHRFIPITMECSCFN